MRNEIIEINLHDENVISTSERILVDCAWMQVNVGVFA